MLTNANHVLLSPLSFLARCRRAFAAKSAVVDHDGTQVSYAEFGAGCDAMAGAARAGGIGLATGSRSWTSTAAGCWPRTSACQAPALRSSP